MKLNIRRLLTRIAAGFAVFALVVAGMIAFGGPSTPPVQAQLAASDTRIGAGLSSLPIPESFKARDGASLSFKRYPGVPGRGVVVLVHGSSGSNSAVHQLAQALSASGVTAVAVDMRGHGASGPHGDIAYLGQLDDDMADLASMLDRDLPGEHRLLMGHSSGGGFVLRIAGGPVACHFDGFIALSPYLHYTSPSNRSGAGWASPGMLRIIGLSIVNRVGLHAFDGLPALAFALPLDAHNRTATYSWRLMQNFGLAMNGWEETVKSIDRPTRVIIGADDELFHADQYPEIFARLQPAIPVKIVPGVGHMGMVLDPAALDESTKAVAEMLGSPAKARCR